MATSGFLVARSATEADNGSVACLHVLGTGTANGLPENWENEWRDARAIVPAGLFLVGFHRVVDDEKDVETTLTTLRETLKSHKAFVVVAASVNGKTTRAQRVDSGSEVTVKWAADSEWSMFVDETALFRLQTTLHAVWQLPVKNVGEVIERTTAKVLASSTVVHFPEQRVLAHTVDDAATCASLVSTATSTSSATPIKGKKQPQQQQKSKLDTSNIVNATLLVKRDAAPDKAVVSLNVHTTPTTSTDFVTLDLMIDLIAIAASSESISTVQNRLKQAVADQVAVMLAHATTQSTTLRPFHFRPMNVWPYLVTVFYPVDDTLQDDVHEKYLEPYRQRMHRRLGLPEDRPIFRMTQAYRFADAKLPSAGRQNNGRLSNVHRSVPASDVVNGKQYVVDGGYDYYHYMQDNFNDNGWGCAYRSFQTLSSWLLHQNYATKAVPSHTEVQQALVDLGDKEKSFVGSKQWIGSFEISLLLDHFYNTSARIIHMQSGSDFPSKSRELAKHFQTEGTPIMIGGGVLAYTLLGIDFNEDTGDVRYLILDPHYTGREDLQTITSKGWCGWKKADLFLPGQFYNLCLPLRPKII